MLFPILLAALIGMATGRVVTNSEPDSGEQLLYQLQNIERNIIKGSQENTNQTNVGIEDIQTTTQSNSDIVAVSGRVPGHMVDVCEVMCPKWCQKITNTEGSYTNCHYLCGDLCNKRSAGNNPFIGNSRYEVVPSDFQFDRYDINKDKRVSKEEFARVEKISQHESSDLFLFADFNRDGFIDSNEFKGGPLVFTVQMAAELSSMALQDIAIQTTTTTTSDTRAS